MPGRADRRLDDLLASPTAESWRERLAHAFFDADAREQALRELRAYLQAADSSLSDEQRAEAEGLLLADASLRAVPPSRGPAAPILSGPALVRRVLHQYPYPIARPFLALKEAQTGAGAFGCLLDTFEALVHFLAVVAVSAYQRSGLVLPECNRLLVERFLKGMWSVGDLFALLRDTVRLAGDCGGHLPYGELPAHLFDARGKPTASLQVLESFLSLRNRLWGHGTGRTDATFAQALPANRQRFEEELGRMTWLEGWELIRPTHLDETGRVSKADLLMGIVRMAGEDYPLQVDPGDLDAHGGCVRAEKSLLLVSPDRSRYLPLFPLSLFGVKPNRRDGIYLLQGCQWRSGQPRRLKDAAYVAYEADLERHTEPANDLAATRIEQMLERLAAGAGVPLAKQPPATHDVLPAEDPDCDLPEVRVEQQSHLRSFVGREAFLSEVAEWIERRTEGGYLLLLGPPGQGKSALMAELARREQPRGGCLLHMVKSHRDPRRFVPALIGQAAKQARTRFGADAYRGDLQDLRNALVRGLEAVRERAGRAVLLVDALDELMATDELSASFAQLEFLPSAPPAGVRVVLTCRPDIPLVQALRARLSGLAEREVPILGEGDFRVLLERRLGAEALAALDGTMDTRVVFARLGGNPLFLRASVEHIAREVECARNEGRASRIDPADLPASYLAFFRAVYNRVGERAGTRWTSPEGRHKARLLQLLCVARSPLGYEELAGLMTADGSPLTLEDCRDRLDEMSQYLLDVGGRFKPWHQGLADHVRAEVLGSAGLRPVEETFCRWLREAGTGDYGLRFRVHHLLAAGGAEEAAGRLTDLAYLEARAEAGQVFDLAADFGAVAQALPPGHPSARILRLLEEALRTDLHFIARHPSTLFQCLWNRGWWYDCPEAAKHYDPPEGGWHAAGPPWSRPGPRLSALLESWRAVKERQAPAFSWLRSLRPPATPLGIAQRAVFCGHDGGVNALALSPDGSVLATGSEDGTVRLWDAASGVERACLPGHVGSVLAVVWSPEGGCLLSAGRDGIVRVWDIRTRTERHCLRGSAQAVHAVAFSPDALVFASGARDGLVRLWNADGRERASLRGHRYTVTGVAFSPDGRFLASASRDRTVRLWDVASGTERACMSEHTGGVNAVSFSPDGQWLASAADDLTVRVWDVQRGVERYCLRGHQGWVRCVNFSSDGSRLVSGARDGTVRIWDTASGNEWASFGGHQGWVRGVIFRPDGRLALSGADDGTVRVWDVVRQGSWPALRSHKEPVLALAFSPDGTRLASGANDRTVRFWDVPTGVERSCLRGHQNSVLAVAFSPDGAHLASAGVDPDVLLWDVSTSQLRYTLSGHQHGIACLAFSPDGRCLLSGSYDATIRVWDTRTGTACKCLRGHHAEITSLAFSPDGGRIASGSGDHTIRVWDLAEGREIDCLRNHRRSVSSIAFSPDGKLLTSGGYDCTVRVWNLATGEQRAYLVGHEAEVTEVAFSPDGQTVLSASVDETVYRWDLRANQRQVLHGRRDLRAIVGRSGRFRWLPLARGLETAVESVEGQALAWFPVRCQSFLAHPSGCVWASSDGGHVYLLNLEGEPDCAFRRVVEPGTREPGPRQGAAQT